MQHYEFPIIEHINDVLPAIAERDEFVVVDRDYGRVINYHVNFTDTFPNPAQAPDHATAQHWAMRRECRGLIFNTRGQLISRAFHKFFNVNEKDETQVHAVDLSLPHVILEKLDGSMVRPVCMDAGSWRLGTKMGVTDVSNQAEAWVCDRQPYINFINRMIAEQYTPIFEWCSRRQRIVIDYPVDRLVLTAVRNNRTGTYVDLSQLDVDAGIELVREFAGTVENMQHLVEQTCALTDQEGWVIRFANGHMLKLKADLYVQIHKAKDRLTQEKNVISMILQEQLDDVKAALPQEDRRRLDQYEQNFWMGIADRVALYQTLYQDLVVDACANNRRQFALEMVPKLDCPHAAGILFGMMDGKNAHSMVVDRIRKHLCSQTRVDQARLLWSNMANWNYNFERDA